jgi:hypothetical protein
MISIDAYRARIGQFQTGKVKQRSLESNFGNIFEKNSSSEREKPIFLMKKQSCFLILAGSLLLSTLCLEQIKEGKPTDALDSQSCRNFFDNDCKELAICSMTHASVLASQLLIGNIESNPGPVDMKEFLAFLYTDTEDPVIKDVLNDFKACQDRATNLKKIKSKKVENLKSTLAYLNDWDRDDGLVKDEIEAYTKEGIALLVLKKIYSMAPEECSSCKKIYYFKPGEFCVLSCFRCNRGACPDCYEKEREKLSSSSMFNKCIFFSCTSCTKMITSENRDENNYKKKSASKADKSMKDTTETTENEMETIDLVDEDGIANDVDVLAEAIGNLKLTKSDTKESNDTEKPEKPEDHKPKKKSEDKQAGKKSPCKYYQNNVCQFGISGKGCNFFHQKPCPKLMKQGFCKKDGKCSNFHPQMCKFSLNRRICLNPKCEYMHVKGTRRESNENHRKSSGANFATKTSNRSKNAKSTYSTNMKNPQEPVTKKTSLDNDDNSKSFLGQRQNNPSQHLKIQQHLEQALERI